MEINERNNLIIPNNCDTTKFKASIYKDSKYNILDKML